MAESVKKVLIVEDESTLRVLLAKALQDCGFEVIAPAYTKGCKFYSAAMECLQKNSFCVAVCDLALPDDHDSISVTTGLELIRTIKNMTVRPHIIAISASIDEGPLESVKKMGAGTVHSKIGKNAANNIIESVKRLASEPLPQKKGAILGM